MSIHMKLVLLLSDLPSEFPKLQHIDDERRQRRPRRPRRHHHHHHHSSCLSVKKIAATNVCVG